jgi:hypothetical protein
VGHDADQRRDRLHRTHGVTARLVDRDDAVRVVDGEHDALDRTLSDAGVLARERDHHGHGGMLRDAHALGRGGDGASEEDRQEQGRHRGSIP